MEKYLNIWREIRRICARFCEKICRFCDFGTIRRISCDFISAPNFKSELIWGVVLYLIALFALLCGDIYYADDLNRAISDYGGNYYNRYFTEFILTKALTLGKGTLDISPLPQILGVVFVVLSAMILLYLIRKKFDFIGIVASLPLGLSPHFLQNLSYKFDALTMSLALFFAVLPFLFQRQARIFCAVSVVCLLLMFMIYQAANATYIILSLYFALFATSQNLKSRLKFLLLCALNLIFASLIYGLFIDNTNLGIGDAYATHEIARDFFTRVASNIAQYFATIFSDFKQTPYIWLIALNCTLFVLNYKNRRIYALLFLALGLCASYGLYLVLEAPLFHPRAFYGFNTLIALICIANVSYFAESNVFCHSERSEESQKNNRVSSVALLPQNDNFLFKILRLLSRATVLITAYFLISFANIYGNALTKQDEYLDFRAKALLSDLSNVIPRGATITIDISKIGNAKVAQRFYDKYGFYLVIPQLARQDDFWFNMKLRHLNAPYNLNNDEMCNFMQENFGSEVIFKNAYHTIERVKSCYIVTLK